MPRKWAIACSFILKEGSEDGLLYFLLSARTPIATYAWLFNKSQRGDVIIEVGDNPPYNRVTALNPKGGDINIIQGQSKFKILVCPTNNGRTKTLCGGIKFVGNCRWIKKKAFPCQGKLFKNIFINSLLKCKTYERKTFYTEFSILGMLMIALATFRRDKVIKSQLIFYLFFDLSLTYWFSVVYF